MPDIQRRVIPRPPIAVDSGGTAVRLSLRRNGTVLLAAVAAVFGVLQVALGPARLGFGWDETVYLSQVAHVPTAFFSAPRARGVSWLAAPVAGVTTSPAAIRAYLLVLGCVGLVLAFRLWLRLLDTAVVVLAAVLFASLWVTQFYANEAMPNYWIALLAVGGVACAARGVRSGAWRHYLGYALCLIGIALIRPSDAIWLAIPLIASVAIRRWRRIWLVLSTAIALVIGVAPWVVEAQLHYGGVRARLDQASRIEGGLRPHLGFVSQARSLYGPLLCRPCTGAGHSPAFALWWFAVPIIVAGALVAARHTSAFPPLVAAAATGAFVAAPYLFLVDYAAPRFLIPAYALVSLPLAWVGLRAVSALRERWAPAPQLAVCLLAAFVLIQGVAAYALSGSERQLRNDYNRIAHVLALAGVREPCVIVGGPATPVAFRADCASRAVRGHDKSTTAGGLRATAEHESVALIKLPGSPRPPIARGWRRIVLPSVQTHGLVAYISPPVSTVPNSA